MNKIMYKIILGLFTVLIISEGYLLRVRTAENINLVNENRELKSQLKNINYPFIGFFRLLAVCSSYDLGFIDLNQAIEKDNSLYLTAEQKSELSKKNNKSIRLLANTQKLAKSFTEGHDLLSKLTTVLTENKLSEVSFEITDKAIQLQANLPFELSQNKESFESLLSKKSTMPNLLTHFPEVVQYYTTINAGALEELKTALFPLFPAEKNPDELWKKADSMCNMFLSISLEELLFSWTGEEFSAFGIRGHNEPVFAIQIKNEDQRQLVFEKIISSFLIKNDASLILNGVRLPQLQLPGFINSLLSLFNINIPFPYYVENDGFIYFSESPESLCQLITSIQDGTKLSKTELKFF